MLVVVVTGLGGQGIIRQTEEGRNNQTNRFEEWPEISQQARTNANCDVFASCSVTSIEIETPPGYRG